MSKSPAVAVLLSAERSGTHYLRSILYNTGCFHTPGEVANASISDSETDESFFFKFSLDFANRNGPAAANSPDGIQKLMDEYIMFLERISAREGRTFLCDIKYSHVHNFNHFWWDAEQRPFLIDFLEFRNIPIIHLIREGVGNTAFSGIYARHTQVWNTVDPEEVKRTKIYLQREEVSSEIRRISKGVKTYINWLSSVSNVTTLRYEDIVRNPSKSLQKIMKCVNLDALEYHGSDFCKVTAGDYSEIVENFDEVRDLIEYRI